MAGLPVASNDTSPPAQRSALALGDDIAKAARHTLLSMERHRSIAQLALRYEHVAAPDSKEIAYAMGSRCYYGPRFARMDRYSQTFVVAHETMHHVLGHLPMGALLFKREGPNFCPLGFNIAADAIINYVLEDLPDVDVLGPTLRYGVRKCQEFGIVNWPDLVSQARQRSAEAKIPLDPVFKSTPDKLSAVDIYHALMRLRRAWRANNPTGNNDPVKAIGDALDAHDDLFDAIKDAATNSSEGDLNDQIHRSEDTLRRVQAGAGQGDAILRVKQPDGLTKTPWPLVMRRLASNALLSRPTINPSRPARRTLSAMGARLDPKSPAVVRQSGVQFEPRLTWQRPAKKCVTIIDTSHSMFQDRQLIEDCIREIATICRRVDSSQTIIFADAEVCQTVSVEDSLDAIKTLVPSGGGGTDFRPAINAAVELKPDLIIYMTDLCGTFPAKAPPCPLIWAYPPEWENIETPFGMRLPLHP